MRLVDRSDVFGVRRALRWKHDTDGPHERHGGRSRSPQSEDPRRSCRGVGKRVPLSAWRHEERSWSSFDRLVVTSDQQKTVEHVDPLVESVVRVRWRSVEPSRDCHLRESKPFQTALQTGKDFHRTARVRDRRSLAGRHEEAHTVTVHRLWLEPPQGASTVGPRPADRSRVTRDQSAVTGRSQTNPRQTYAAG